MIPASPFLVAPNQDVRGEIRRGGFGHAIAQGGKIQALEHRLAAPEQDGRDREVQFVGARQLSGNEPPEADVYSFS